MTRAIPERALNIHARLRPKAIAALYAWEAGLGLVIGTQVASVAANAYGRHPAGDLPLFSAGGLELLDLLRHSMVTRGPLVAMMVLVMLAAHIAGIFPAAAALAELAFVQVDRQALRAEDALSRAFLAFPASLTVLVLQFATQAIVLILGVAAATASSTLVAPRLGEKWTDIVTASVILVAIVAAGVLGILGDVARAAVVRRECSAYDGLDASVTLLRRGAWRLLWSYGWRTGASWVPVVMGLAVTAHARRHGLLALVVLTVFHQTIVLVRVALRTSWMAKTLRVLGD